MDVIVVDLSWSTYLPPTPVSFCCCLRLEVSAELDKLSSLLKEVPNGWREFYGRGCRWHMVHLRLTTFHLPPSTSVSFPWNLQQLEAAKPQCQLMQEVRNPVLHLLYGSCFMLIEKPVVSPALQPLESLLCHMPLLTKVWPALCKSGYGWWRW